MTSRFSFDASSVPLRQEGGADSHQIGAEDRFVLDSVDGLSSVEELAMMLAMNEEEILDTLDRLTEQKLIHAMRPPVDEVSQTRQLQATADFPVDDLLAQLQRDKSAPSVGAAPPALRPDSVAAASSAAKTVTSNVVGARPSALKTIALGLVGAQTTGAEATGTDTTGTDVKSAKTVSSNTVDEPASSQKTVESGVITSEYYDSDEEGASTVRLAAPAAVFAERPEPPLPPKHAGPVVAGMPPMPTSAPPPPLPPPTRSAPAAPPEQKPEPRRSLETPRRHLDPTWWKGMGKIEEPDELLTSREISRSGVLPIQRGSGTRDLSTRPTDVGEQAGLDAANFTEPMQRPAEGFGDASGLTTGSGSYPRQTFERPPGGFLGAVEPSAVQARETSEVAVLRRDDQTAEVEAVSPEIDLAAADAQSESEQSYVNEVAHTRSGQAPLLPDVEMEDDWRGGSEDATGPQVVSCLWSDEPLATMLRADKGGWELDEAQRLSYYLRLIQTGTYYDIFGISSDADSGEITFAAEALRRNLRLHALKVRATDAGVEAILSVKRGTARALDVLLQPEARSQYDAALAALAAFKL